MAESKGKGRGGADGSGTGPAPGVGARIRRRRLQLGIRQSDLAERLGISAAYLNLIEHDRRRVAGRLLNDAARELDVPVSRLAQGAAGALVEELRAAAAAEPGAGDVDPALAEALAGAFPAWAGLIAAQARRLAAQDRAIATLSDRLTHDPFLSESIHEVLSSVTAIRSTAGILKDEEELDPEWRKRFHRNLYEDSRRLAEGAQALVAYLDAGARTDRSLDTPQEEVEAWFTARGWQVPELEEGDTTPEAVLAADAPANAAARTLALRHLTRYAADARALPLGPFAAAVAEDGRDPLRLAGRFGVDPMAVFRRLAHLPERISGRVGLVTCDGSGTLTFRRPIDGFGVPRYGAACPLWPLYTALTRPMQPVRQVVQPVGTVTNRFVAYALARPSHPDGFDGPGVTEAAMLLVYLDTAAEGPVFRVGTSCRICALSDCPARREPSVVALP